MLGDIAVSFLRLGTTAFGGPAAHIAMMEEEFVRRRGWISHAEFLDMLGAANLIPGPNSTEMAIHIGHQRGGGRGERPAVDLLAVELRVADPRGWDDRPGRDAMVRLSAPGDLRCAP